MSPNHSDIPKRVHLVGIGGAGMSGLAECLLSMKHVVSGSDLQRSRETDFLLSLGARISYEHAPNNVAQTELIVASDAIPDSNVELEEARLRGIRIVRRAQCLDLLGRLKKSVMVAGSHGKSTTSAMIAKVLNSAAAEPSYVIGANVPSLGDRRACICDGAHFVGEACEAFQNLDSYHPDIAVITNIDDDHIDHYGSQAKLDEAFRRFASRTAAEGIVVAGGDDVGVRRILQALDVRVMTFGFGSANDVSVGTHEYDAIQSRFEVNIKGRSAGIVYMPVPGRHAISNALACIATANILGIDFQEIANGLRGFTGVSHRWEDHGVIAGVRIIEDYAHHPTALNALIGTARSIFGENRRLVVAFQPQLYSRTQRLYRQFAHALSASNLLLLLEIDPSGERDNGARSHLIADEMRKRDAAVQTFGDVDDFVERAPSLISSGDVLLLVGAGSIRTAINRLSQQLSAGVTNRSALTFRPRPTLASSPSFRTIGRRLRFAFNRHGSVVSRFRFCAARSPTRCAVSDGGNKLNYGELDDISDALSTVFKAHGIGRGTVVGVHLSASTDLIIVMLALMKIGAVYLPVDINLPADRVRYMLATAESKLVITSSKMKIGAGTAGIDLLDLETLQAELNNLHHISKAPAAPRSEDTAYICFTSGSTGYPKAIATTHRSLLSLVSDITERFGVCPDTRMALNTSISFDVSLAEMWMALYGGGQLIVAASSKPFIGEHLADFIEDNEVTHIATTPSILASLRPRALPSLACIVCAGEACPPELVDIWARGRRFINAYGPTEATIYATATECFPGKIVTIGKALAHINTYVVDTHLNQIQPGEIGELCLGGGGVAEGYIGLDQESRDKFVILRQEGKTIDRVYKTGDVVRLDQDGNFIFLGRLDNQIKLLGNRIELEEIEHSLRRIPGIADAAICLDDSGASKKLVCFAVTDDDQATDWAKISESLLEWLPSYMLPTHFVRVRSIPLTSNGKKDRRALIAKHQAKFNGQVEYAPPRNDIEAKLVSIWKDILEVEGDIGVYDNFAAVGGDSLKSLLLIEEVEQKFGVRAPPGYFGRITTITRIAVQVAELLWVGDQQRVTERPGFLASRIYKQMRDLTADWTGTRARDTSLIASYGGENAIYDLFLCVQYEVELLALLKHLGDEFRLHGIRSGHLVMDYSPDNIDQLCSYYVEELKQIAPTGKLVMGGVCQGGVIAHAMACRLQKHGDEGTPLILVEQAKLLPFSGKAAFFYAENSFLNPFKRYESGTARYDDVYGVRYSLDILPGEHGGLFNEPTVQFLVQKLRSRIL